MTKIITSLGKISGISGPRVLLLLYTHLVHCALRALQFVLLRTAVVYLDVLCNYLFKPPLPPTGRPVICTKIEGINPSFELDPERFTILSFQ